MSKNIKNKNTKKYIPLLDDLIEEDDEESKIYTNNKPTSYINLDKLIIFTLLMKKVWILLI